jgi:hypothetical protein
MEQRYECIQRMRADGEGVEYTLLTRADSEGVGSIILDPRWRESRAGYLELITLSARIPPL